MPEDLRALIETLSGIIHAPQAEVAGLRARLGKDSRGSGEPPSSGGPAKKPVSLRKASGRKPGGQKGRAGHAPGSALPNTVAGRAPPGCRDACGAASGLPRSAVVGRRQAAGLPPAAAEGAEHRASAVTRTCGKVRRGTFPAGVSAPVQYGSRLKAACVYLARRQLSPVRRSAGVPGHLFGTPVSAAAAMGASGVPPSFAGTAAHGGRASCRGFPCQHAPRNAHHLREPVHAGETARQPWARAVTGFLCRAKGIADRARAGPAASTPGVVPALRREYGTILSRAGTLHPALPASGKQRGRAKRPTAANLPGRLRKHAGDVLRFLPDPGAPSGNSPDGRDTRMPKLERKTSGCFRTLEGAENFAIIRPYLSTLAKQGKNAPPAIALAFQGSNPHPLPSG